MFQLKTQLLRRWQQAATRAVGSASPPQRPGDLPRACNGLFKLLGQQQHQIPALRAPQSPCKAPPPLEQWAGTPADHTAPQSIRLAVPCAARNQFYSHTGVAAALHAQGGPSLPTAAAAGAGSRRRRTILGQAAEQQQRLVQAATIHQCSVTFRAIRTWHSMSSACGAALDCRGMSAPPAAAGPHGTFGQGRFCLPNFQFHLLLRTREGRARPGRLQHGPPAGETAARRPAASAGCCAGCKPRQCIKCATARPLGTHERRSAPCATPRGWAPKQRAPDAR